MPDLHQVVFFRCKSAEGWQNEVTGSTGKKYTVSWTRWHKNNEKFTYDFACSCKGYTNARGYCKHIEQVRDKFCGWDQQVHGGTPEPTPQGMVCPKCLGELTPYYAAV
jgi:hypothetical protein